MRRAAHRASQRSARPGLLSGLSVIRRLLTVLSFGVCWPLALSAQVVDTQPLVSDAPDLKVTERIGSQLPLSVQLRDESGAPVILSQYFQQGRPVILTPVYYSCPLLCNLVLNGFVQGLKEKGLIPGQDFEVVSFSIDSRENKEVSRAKKASYIDMLGVDSAADGWHFLTADREVIKTLTGAVGFPFRFDQATQQYLHPGTIIFLSDSGRVERYLYGTYYPGVDLYFALVDAGLEASLSKTTERALFIFDPRRHRYVLSPPRLLLFSLGAAVFCFGPIMVLVWRRFARRRGAAL